MSHIRVKLDSPSLRRGPATVIRVGLDGPQPDTLRVGEVDWLDDSEVRLTAGDRVELNVYGVCRVGRADIDRLELAREVAATLIHDGQGLDVEDMLDVRSEANVGEWVAVRVLVTDERIDALIAARKQAKHGGGR